MKNKNGVLNICNFLFKENVNADDFIQKNQDMIKKFTLDALNVVSKIEGLRKINRAILKTEDVLSFLCFYKLENKITDEKFMEYEAEFLKVREMLKKYKEKISDIDYSKFTCK